jgi:hypothetical protein
MLGRLHIDRTGRTSSLIVNIGSYVCVAKPNSILALVNEYPKIDRRAKAVAASEPIDDVCLFYNEVLLAQARITAACNALHQVEARFCRWLLQTRDRAESDTIMLTQEFLSEMLGVRRTTVTEVACKIQANGRCDQGHVLRML